MLRLRSRDVIAPILAVLVAAGGIAVLRYVPAGDAEDEADFRQTMAGDVKFVNAMLADTEAGKNVSDFRIGMFAMGLLGDLSERDPALGAYFHQNGRLMQSYLTDVFQYHSDDEVAHVAALAAKGGETRRAAQFALESLRHIPVEKDPPEQQAADRKDLAAALAALGDSLAKLSQK